MLYELLFHKLYIFILTWLVGAVNSRGHVDGPFLES
jgi:hypothetical protein